MRSILSVAFITMVFLSGACGKSLIVKKPASKQTNDAMTEMWAKDIRRVARSGDWILTRSYSMTGDVVVGVTLGESFSHASIYDAERGTAIEAINPIVREVALERLLARNRYVVIVRPFDLVEEQRLASVTRARSVIGAKFDYAGLFGVDDQSKFYCSELVAWASGIKGAPRIVTPADLFERGELIYLSGPRDELQNQAAALHQKSRSRSRERVAVR